MVTSEHDKLTVALSRYPAKARSTKAMVYRCKRVGMQQRGQLQAGTRRASTEQTGQARGGPQQNKQVLGDENALVTCFGSFVFIHEALTTALKNEDETN